MGNAIVRPITDDGLVGYDDYGQLVLYKHERDHVTMTFVADVRDKTCAICSHGWQPTAASMDDQQFWSLLDGHVHETCLWRHFGLIDRADFHGAICAARIRFRGLVAIPNGYWPDAYREKLRPWFKAELIDHAASLVIGSRKRVIELRVLAEGPSGFEWAQQAEEEFADENVTKDFSDRMILLHAWSTEKLRDYIKRIAKVSGFGKDLEREREKASKAEAGGGSAQSGPSLIAVRESAETAQAGDATAARSASPSHVSGESGAGTPIASAAGAGSAGPKPVSAIPTPDELCDIDDLPDCLVGGTHQPHCRHAGKPVTVGGNP